MKYIIESEDVSKRLDIYVNEKQDSITRSYIKRLIENSDILVNGNKVKSGYLLKLNDEVIVEIPEDVTLDIKPEESDLDIVYEDNDLLIINKAKGVVVHPANGNYTGTLVNFLMNSHKNDLSSINGVIRPGIVHRIDKDTSGILVVAKNDNAHKKLSEQFKEHSINRVYIALVKGIIKEDAMDIDLPIGRSQRDRKKMAVTDKNSRNAITHIKVLERYYTSNLTLVEARLETGRTHQIRVHMSYMHHPLVGDNVYSKDNNKIKVKGQMLHAKYLSFIHPTSEKTVEFDSELPEYFKEIVEKLENKEKAAQ